MTYKRTQNDSNERERALTKQLDTLKATVTILYHYHMVSFDLA